MEREWLAFALATGLACAGCGSGSGSGGSPNATPLLGTWSCTGTQVETCGADSHTDTSDFKMKVAQGASADAITTTISDNTDVTTGTSGGSGEFSWTVSGSVANLDSPVTAPTEPGSVGGTWTPTYSSGSLTPSGALLLWSASGSAVYVNGTTQTCGFTQSYSCSTSGASGGDAGGSNDDASSEPKLDPSLVATWSYSEGFFYPNPAGTPGLDVPDPPKTLTLKTNGTFTTSATSTPFPQSGKWSTGATTPADWKAWRQQYNFPEKLTLDGTTTWDGYVDDGDPSGESVGPPQCLDLFYRQKKPQAGYYYFVFCQPAPVKK